MEDKDFIIMCIFRLSKFVAYLIFPLLINACAAPIVPDNYLSAETIRTPQKINGVWISPRVIPISAQMLNSPEGQALLRPAMKPQPYKVGAFDVLNIIVWGHPELSTISSSTAGLPTGEGLSGLNIGMNNNPPVLVQTEGNIFYPYVGHIRVAGLTINEIQNKIAHQLSKYIRNPQVSVQVIHFRNRNIYVLGEVKTPGQQPLTDKPLTLMEAISVAGNINPSSSDPSHIYLIRGSYQKPDIFWLNAQSSQSLLIAEQFPLQENDIVYVSHAMLTPWNNFLNTLLGNLTAYGAIKGGLS
jgi:protein involved in polysaccharide export with SLBB domain